MKKKSPRGIPDFAPKRPGFGPLSKLPLDKGVRPTPPPTPPRVKPPSTSAKSGRRGS